MNAKSIKTKLAKVYSRNLCKITKEIIDSQQNCLVYIATYLQLMRDQAILSGNCENNENKKEYYFIVANKLACALAEYDKFNSCRAAFFDKFGNKLPKFTEISSDELLEMYNKEYEKHWMQFWALLADAFKTNT